MKLYVYTLEDNLHIATITGYSSKACGAKADEVYDFNETYGCTYSPSFGCSDGLTENWEAEEIEA